MIDKNHGHLVCVASSAGLIGVNGLAGKAFIHLCPHISYTTALSPEVLIEHKVLQGFKSFKQHVSQEIYVVVKI